MCFLMMRTMLPRTSRKVRVSTIALYTPAASASACTLAQLVPSQMSEPWHVSKPARQAGCRLRASTGAGWSKGQRTVTTSVAITVRHRGPSAERLGLRNASGSPMGVQHEKGAIQEHVEHRVGEFAEVFGNRRDDEKQPQHGRRRHRPF